MNLETGYTARAIDEFRFWEIVMTVIEKLLANGVVLTEKDLQVVANKYGIKEMSVFGSSLRKDFNDASDLDLIIEFKNSDEISLIDLVDIQMYFEQIINRKVDIVEPAGLKNPYRRKAILKSKEAIYVA